MITLKLGSKGEDVKKLQSFLGITVDGDFGKITERLVKEWQLAHELVSDGIVGDKTWSAMFPSNPGILEGVVYNPIDVHITKKPGRKIKYLVIHFTAGSSSKKGAAEANRKVFLQREASADFIVDDETMLQVNPDPENYYCWAVGDGKGKYGIFNRDCISIEICSNLKKGTTAKVPNHNGWYFTEESLNNAVCLSKMIMERYHIPLENVIRHKDATQKLCPGIVGWNDGPIYDPITGKKTNKINNNSLWIKFKERLK